MGSLTGAVDSKNVTESYKGILARFGNPSDSASA